MNSETPSVLLGGAEGRGGVCLVDNEITTEQTLHYKGWYILLTLSAHAQRGFTVLSTWSVCLSVRLYSRTTGNDAAYERYQQL